MLVHRLSALALLGALPFILADCSSDPTPTGTAGAPGAGAPSAGAPGAGASSAGAPGAGAPGAGAPGAGAPSGGAPAGGSGGSSGGSSAGTAGSAGKAGGGSGGAAGSAGGSSAGASGAAGGGSGTFVLTSPDHMEGAKFAKAYTCDAMNGTFGAGVNPELDWSGAPAGTMSFAITFIDTTLGDTNSMGQHWAIWNIPATVMKFPQGTKMLSGDLAAAKQNGAFLTPCAQSLMNGMDDQYEFTVYALSTATLNITGTTVANALTALKAAAAATPSTVLGKATLHGHAGLKGK